MMPAATGHPTSGLESTPRPLFAVRNLQVDFLTADGPVRAVDGVDFAVDSGRTLGIVGESGSGKTVSTLAALGLLPGRTPIRVSGRELHGEMNVDDDRGHADMRMTLRGPKGESMVHVIASRAHGAWSTRTVDVEGPAR